MTNLTTKLNKLVLDDSPSEKLINAWDAGPLLFG